MNPEIFREYDIRGIAEKDLSDETALLIGKAYGTLIHNKFGAGAEIVVGRDNRISSPRIAKALIEGILSCGVNVVFIGEITTPMLYYAVNKLNKSGGISVTASHNPPQYNGFKVMVGKEAIFGEKIQELRKIAEKENFVAGKKAAEKKFEAGKKTFALGEKKILRGRAEKFVASENSAEGRGTLREESIDEKYINEIASLVKVQKKLKVVVDAGNGMASEFAPRLLEKIGCEVIRLYCVKDPSFPNHIPDPVQEKNSRDLMEKAVESKADLGIGFDGDVDRIGVVDEKGTLIYGDTLLGLLAEDLLEREKHAKIIFEVKCSQGLGEWIKEKGGKPIMWKTGHSLIKAKMREEKALLAGEMSGHMFFTEKWYGFDDALLAAVKIIEIVSKQEKNLSELVARMPKYYSSPEYRVDFPEKEKFSFVEKAKKHFSAKYKAVTIDGVRVHFGRGWALLRASNTQPKLILRFEGKTKQELESIKEKFLSEVESFSGKRLALE